MTQSECDCAPTVNVIVIVLQVPPHHDWTRVVIDFYLPKREVITLFVRFRPAIQIIMHFLIKMKRCVHLFHKKECRHLSRNRSQGQIRLIQK